MANDFAYYKSLGFDDDVINKVLGDNKPASEPSGFLRKKFGDLGVSAAKGIVGLPQAFVGLADMATGGAVGKAIEDYTPIQFKQAQEELNSWYTPEYLAKQKAVNEAQGFVDTLKALGSNEEVALQSIVESLPQMVGGAGIGRGVLKALPKIGASIAAGIGEGAITAGSGTEQTREASKTGYVTPEQIAYNLAAGVGTGVMGAAANKFMGSKLMGGRGTDVDTAMVRGGLHGAEELTAETPKQNLFKQFGKGIFSEGVLEEMPQSAQEQVFQNLAQGKPWDEGVGNAAAQGLASGGLMGGAVGGAGSIKHNATVSLLSETKTREEKLAAQREQAAQAERDARIAAANTEMVATSEGFVPRQVTPITEAQIPKVEPTIGIEELAPEKKAALMQHLVGVNLGEGVVGDSSTTGMPINNIVEVPQQLVAMTKMLDQVNGTNNMSGIKLDKKTGKVTATADTVIALNNALQSSSFKNTQTAAYINKLATQDLQTGVTVNPTIQENVEYNPETSTRVFGTGTQLDNTPIGIQGRVNPIISTDFEKTAADMPLFANKPIEEPIVAPVEKTPPIVSTTTSTNLIPTATPISKPIRRKATTATTPTVTPIVQQAAPIVQEESVAPVVEQSPVTTGIREFIPEGPSGAYTAEDVNTKPKPKENTGKLVSLGETGLNAEHIVPKDYKDLLGERADLEEKAASLEKSDSPIDQSRLEDIRDDIEEVNNKISNHPYDAINKQRIEEANKQTEEEKAKKPKPKNKKEKTKTNVATEEGSESLFSFQTDKQTSEKKSQAHSEYTALLNSDKSTGASRSISKSIRGFVDQISTLFKLKTRIFITTTSDMNSSNLKDVSDATREIHDEKGNYVGMYYKTDDGVAFLVLNDNIIKSTAGLLRTLSHEMGHAIIEDHLESADEATQKSIVSDYANWVAKLEQGDSTAIDELYQDSGKSWEDFKKEYAEHLDENGLVKDSMFAEYVAEQVAKYIKQSEVKPKGVIAKFFSDLLADLKALFNLTNKTAINNRLPVQSITNWLDNLKLKQPDTTKAESKFWQSVFSNEADLSELHELVPSATFKDGVFSFAPEDTNNLQTYIDDVVRLNEGERLPPSFYNPRKFYSRINYDPVQAAAIKEKVGKNFYDFVSKFGLNTYWMGELFSPVLKRIMQLNTEMPEKIGWNTDQVQKDSNGNNLYTKAMNMLFDLDKPRQGIITNLLYKGDRDQKVYTTLEQANAAIKDYSNDTISASEFAVYKQMRETINHMFKKEHELLYRDVLSSTFGENALEIDKAIRANKTVEQVKVQFGEDVADTYAQTKEGLQSLDKLSKQPDNGLVRRIRESVLTAPYRVSIFEEKADGTKDRKFVQHFATKAEAQAFRKNIEDTKEFNKVFPFDKLDNQTNYEVVVDESEEDSIRATYGVGAADHTMAQKMVESILGEMEGIDSLDAATVKKIKNKVNAEFFTRYMERVNEKALKRSKENLSGYATDINPLEAELNAANSIFTAAQRKAYITSAVDYANTLTGSEKREAVESIKDSLKKANKFSQVTNEIATIASLGFSVITAVTQLAQYATHVPALMLEQGIPFKEAMAKSMVAYWQANQLRYSMNSNALSDALRQNKLGLKTMLGSLMGKQEAHNLIETLANKTYEKLSADEMRVIDKHRAQRDTADVITSQQVSLDSSFRGKGINQFRAFVAKPALFMFNQMEVVNREATLLAGYRVFKEQALKEGLSEQEAEKVADEKATKLMLEANGTFNHFNKIGILRKYPSLSPVMALSGFFFNFVGVNARMMRSWARLGKASGWGNQEIRKQALNSMAGQAFLIAALFAMGGAKGEPFTDTINNLLTKMLGKDYLVELEGKLGKDYGVLGDVIMRGVPAITGFDWSSSLSIKMPYEDAITGLLTGKDPELKNMGVLGRLTSDVIKTGTKGLGAIKGENDLAEALKSVPFSVGRVAGAVEVYNKGKTTSQGGVMFDSKGKPLNQGKGNFLGAVGRAMGFRPIEETKEQAITSGEFNVKEHWVAERKSAYNKYFNKLDPYIRDNKPVPPEVQQEARKSIQDFNKELLKADPAVRKMYKPITPAEIKTSKDNRYKPKKKEIQFRQGMIQ